MGPSDGRYTVEVLGYLPMKTGKASVYMPSRMDVKLIPDVMRVVSRCPEQLLYSMFTVAASPRSANESAASHPKRGALFLDTVD